MKQIVVSLNDITQMRRLREDLRDRETRFRALFDHSMDAVLLTTPDDGGVVAANPAACAMFRRSEAGIRRAGRQGLVDSLDPRSDALARKRDREGKVIGELRMVRGDGSRFEAEISSSIYQDSNGKLYSSMIVRDISERVAMQAAMEATNQQLREANEKLARMAHYDLLTQLPNRNLLGDRLQQAMAHADRNGRIVGVAFVDLDGFKSINDQFGHAVGDQVLMHMARRLKSALREGDTLARLGGDEFVAVLGDLQSIDELRPLIQRLQFQAAEPVALGHLTLRVTASIGVTSYPADASDAEQLLRHADQAMYLAKQTGKNQHHTFDVVSDAAVRVRHEELSAIKAGWERGEFVLHYQPEVDMASGKLLGVEALVRWEHPQRGMLGPDQFLPLVEDQEFAVEMGHRILDMALAQMERWQAMGLTVAVSVNLFARQLQDSGFVAKLAQLLERHPTASPRHLVLEIVETKALEDVAQASDAMRACARLGVQFALDDFGTGYSSLTYLKALPASLLKIDKGFVRDMLDDEDDLGIVQGVIGLARAFGREVIAEGVESMAHGRLLLSLGCTLGQGYGIARPMPADELPQWLALWQARQPWARLPLQA
jgi:diguanylate cyclase (GGDEF)-like protein/PAS domain S-box-containing protein